MWMVRCISLLSAGNRRKCFEENFRELEFEFFDAVDGRNLNAAEYYRIIRTSTGRAARKLPTPSEVGCFLSHKLVLQEFLSGQCEKLLVLEDDVKAVDGLMSLDDLKLLPSRVSILGGQEGLLRPRFAQMIGFNAPAVVPNMAAGLFYRTCCYALDRQSAEMISEAYKNYFFIADDWYQICRKAGLKGLLFDTVFAHPENLSDSSIEGERLARRDANSKR